MGVVILDTDVFSYLMRAGDKRADVYKKHIEKVTVAVTFVTMAELLAGAERRNWGSAKREALDQKLALVVKVPFDSEICKVYARLKCGCRNDDGSHRVIAANDLWIASCAIHHGVPLISNNRKHFEGIPGLNLVSEAPAVEALSAQIEIDAQLDQSV